MSQTFAVDPAMASSRQGRRGLRLHPSQDVFWPEMWTVQEHSSQHLWAVRTVIAEPLIAQGARR